ncbi:MAG: Ig-like domain-containing protein, partial [Bacteroidales bacterium]|nr:Ig-like domain-containing protein [Bacteroidales bacterium]
TNTAVSWSSSNTGVATVSGGQVTAVKAGTATITVTTADGNKTATCSVTVEAKKVAVTGVKIDIETLEIIEGETGTIKATVEPADATNKTVNWTTSNAEVATVADGVVTAVAPGTATIIATTADGGKTVTCTVTVNPKPIPVEGVSVEVETVEVVEGETAAVVVKITPEDATVKDVTFASSDESVATVDAEGNVTGVAPGTATITVTTADGGKTATFDVTVTPKYVPVEEVSFTDASVSVAEGQKTTVSVTFNPENPTNQNVTYKSSDETVAKVDAEGNVTGVKPGTATITVTTEDGGKTATCSVTVTKKPVPVSGVTINRTALTLTVGGGAVLVATVSPEDATNKKVTWNSSNEAVAKVDQNGEVTAVKTGTAKITVTTADGGKTATCDVTVTDKPVPATGVKLNKTALSIFVGDKSQLAATVQPSDATNHEVTWSSSNASVATVDKIGNVTGVKAGTATITVKTHNGKTATCTVTVKSKLVTKITLNVTSKTIDFGETFTITPTITPSDAANKSVTWSSNNTSIATVDSNGKVTGIKSGTAVITCKAKDGSNQQASCSVTVKSYEVHHIVYRNQQIVSDKTLPSTINYFMVNGWNMLYFRLIDKTTNRPVDVSTSTLAANVVITSNNKNVVGDATNYTDYERGCYVNGEGTATLTFKYKGVTLGTTKVTVSHTYEIRYNNSSLPSSISFNWENSSDWVSFKLYDTVDKKYVSPYAHQDKLGIQSSSLVAYLGYTSEYFQLKPKNYGSGTINFTYNGEVIGSVKLTIVNPRAITSIDFSSYEVSNITGIRSTPVSVGKTTTVTATISPSAADLSGIEWVIPNTSIATVVSYSGKSCTVRGVAKGNIQLICRDKNSGKSATLGLIVQ